MNNEGDDGGDDDAKNPDYYYHRKPETYDLEVTVNLRVCLPSAPLRFSIMVYCHWDSILILIPNGTDLKKKF